MEKHDKRRYIKTCTALGQKPLAIHIDLIKVYGDSVYSLSAVQKIFAYRSNGDESFYDDHRFEKLITDFIVTNIKLFEGLIIDNPRILYDILEKQIGLCFGTLDNILTKH